MLGLSCASNKINNVKIETTSLSNKISKSHEMSARILNLMTTNFNENSTDFYGWEWQKLMLCEYDRNDYNFIHAGALDYPLMYRRILSLLGLFVYLYIMFSYFYRRRSRAELEHDSFIILSISFGVFVSCIVRVVTTIVSYVWTERDSMTEYSILMSIRHYFEYDITYFLGLLLAFYRYYGSCKPLKSYIRTFSAYRLSIYWIVFLLIGLFYVIYKEVMICDHNITPKTFQDWSAFVIYISHHLYFLLSIIWIFRLHSITATKHQTDINNEERYLRHVLRFHRSRSLSYSSNYGTTSTRSSVYLKEEKQYVGTIRLYMFLILFVLVINYITWSVTSMKALATGRYFGLENKFGLGVIRLMSTGLTDTLLKLHFVFFIRTNEEFKLTLIRPIREFRERFCQWSKPKPYKSMYYEAYCIHHTVNV